MVARSARRNAFTLLEVLIALALSVLLVFTVYASITMYYRYNVAGRGEIAGQQLIRGLTQRFQEDLNSVQFVPPTVMTTFQMQSGPAAEDVTAADSTSGVTPVIEAEPMLSFEGMQEFGLPGLFGLIGTADTLHLCTAHPTREQGYWGFLDRETGGERISDFQVITYGLVTLDAVTMAIMEKELDAIRPDKGLGRRTRDLFANDQVDELPGMVDLLAVEVVEISFQYFDGSNWTDSWDSSASGMLPRAVEVRYGVWSAPPRILGRRNPNRTGSISHFSHQFYLPLSEPVVEGSP